MKIKLPREAQISTYYSPTKRMESFTFPKGKKVDVITKEELDRMYPYRNLNVSIGGWELRIRRKPSIPVWLRLPDGDRRAYFLY